MIRAGQRVGIPLAEVRAARIGLPEDRSPTAAERERVLAGWRDRLTARIARLTALRDQLTGCIGRGCPSLARGALTSPAGITDPAPAWPRSRRCAADVGGV